MQDDKLSKIILCETCKNLSFLKSNIENLNYYVNLKCTNCLGILYPSLLNILNIKIEKYIQKCEHVFCDFNVNLTLPLFIHLFKVIQNESFDIYCIENEIKQIKNDIKNIYTKTISNVINKSYNSNSQFIIVINVSNKFDEILTSKFNISKNNWKSRLNKNELINLKSFFHQFNHYDQYDIQLHAYSSTLYITGRYMKYSREISQTPWSEDRIKKVKGSVQDIICKQIIPIIQCSNVTFSAAGREDIDVLMLGTGRPFVIKCIDPKIPIKPNELNDLQDKINNSTDYIKITPLYLSTESIMNYLSAASEHKHKSYIATIYFDSPLSEQFLYNFNQMSNIKIKQWTPIRVLHRRPLIQRLRTIIEWKLDLIQQNVYKFTLKTEAGTYIKELVHGDFGRTSPNLFQITGHRCDITQLDVSNIDVSWPPEITLIR